MFNGMLDCEENQDHKTHAKINKTANAILQNTSKHLLALGKPPMIGRVNSIVSSVPSSLKWNL